MSNDKPRETLPVSEERVRVEREEVETGRVRVDKRVEHEPVELEVPLTAEEVEVERVAIDREVDQTAGPRVEDDVTIIPVYAERIVAQKQLVLVEEVHVRRRRSERVHRESVDRRVERVEVSRREPNGTDRPDRNEGKRS